MLGGASGVTVGLAAQYVRINQNLVANPAGSQQWDGGVKIWELQRQDLTSVKQNLFAGYKAPVYGASSALVTSGNVSSGTIAYEGSIANCTAKAKDLRVRSTYGQLSGL